MNTPAALAPAAGALTAGVAVAVGDLLDRVTGDLVGLLTAVAAVLGGVAALRANRRGSLARRRTHARIDALEQDNVRLLRYAHRWEMRDADPSLPRPRRPRLLTVEPDELGDVDDEEVEA